MFEVAFNRMVGNYWEATGRFFGHREQNAQESILVKERVWNKQTGKITL
jgi:hypothetical protein